MTTPIITPAECRELAERLRICNHPSETISLDCNDRLFCGKCNRYVHDKEVDKTPNFLDPVVVLGFAMKRPDWLKLRWHIGVGEERRGYNVHEVIILDYVLDTTGKLAKALLEWLRKEQGK